MRSEAFKRQAQADLNNSVFGDSRIFMISRDDPEAALFVEPEKYVITQRHDGPIFITIGEKARDASLEKINARYGVPLDALRAFRNQIAA